VKFDELVFQMSALHREAQRAAGRSAQQITSIRNWLMGAWIVEFEQAGADRAAYGSRLLEQLAVALEANGCVGVFGAEPAQFPTCYTGLPWA